MSSSNTQSGTAQSGNAQSGTASSGNTQSGIVTQQPAQVEQMQMTPQPAANQSQECKFACPNCYLKNRLFYYFSDNRCSDCGAKMVEVVCLPFDGVFPQCKCYGSSTDPGCCTGHLCGC